MAQILSRSGAGRLLAVAALAFLSGAGHMAQAQTPADEAGILRVTGEGQVEAAPDMAVITLGVQSRAATAEAALAETSGRVAAVLDTLRAAGVLPRDMQTSGLSLAPEWENPRAPGRDPGRDGEEPPRIIGFIASNMLTVRLRDLPALGGVLDQIVKAGANSFNGLQFTVSNLRELQDEARRRAVADARARADLYAGAAGVTLGVVRSLTETGGAQPRPFLARDMAMAAESVPVAEGEITISATVEVTYSISE